MDSIATNVLQIAIMQGANNFNRSFFKPINSAIQRENQNENKVLPSLGICRFPRSSMLAMRNTGLFTLYLFRN